jgi:hypothetical protein
MGQVFARSRNALPSQGWEVQLFFVLESDGCHEVLMAWCPLHRAQLHVLHSGSNHGSTNQGHCGSPCGSTGAVPQRLAAALGRHLSGGCCGAGAAMTPISWQEMQCPETLTVEQRKVAKV